MSSNNEWYTPHKYIEAAREVMGSIELDPASCALANQTVKAAKYYTIEDNGLTQTWSGCCWLNPPYGRETTGESIWKGGGKSLVAQWVKKVVSAYQSGEIEQAILLIQSDTDAKWFQPLWNYPICFPEKQIHFFVPAGQNDHHIFGSCFVYFGANEQRFIDVFSRFGRIVKAIDTPKPKPVMLDLWQTVAS